MCVVLCMVVVINSVISSVMYCKVNYGNVYEK